MAGRYQNDPRVASWSNDSDSAFVSMDEYGNQMVSSYRYGHYPGGTRRPQDTRDTIELSRDSFDKNNSDNNMRRGKGNNNDNGNGNQDKFEDDYDDRGEEEEEEVYIVRQEHAYLSVGFSVVQTGIMCLLMWQCGIAPIGINPMVGPYPDALSEWGGKNSYLILEDGEWWRLLTPILLHAGLFHLFSNILVQLEQGAMFEKEWGSVRWLIIYLGSAVGSSALSVIVMPDAVSVGSSGAVMGLFGGKLAEVILRCCERTDTQEKRVGAQMRKEQCVGVTCAVIVVMAFSFVPYVDWAAHLGGLIGGLVVGTCIFALELEFVSCKLLWVTIGVALTAGTYLAAIWYMYNGEIEESEELRDVCEYYRQQFEDYECKCQAEGYRNNNDNGDEHLRF